MENVELVCVICKKEKRGGGVWRYHDNPSTLKKEEELCPDCCQELFPQFYSAYKRNTKPKFTFGKRVFSVFNPFNSKANSTL